MTNDDRYKWVIHVGSDDATDRRLAERLQRAGLPVARTERRSLEGIRRGEFVLATGASLVGSDAERITQLGAHVFLVPPYPVQGFALHSNPVSFSSATRREGVYLAQIIMEVVGKASFPTHPLRILYRDRIAGGISVPLAESASGETLVGAALRASNLHGQLVISTLMLAAASAQTELTDVSLLISALVSWCIAGQTLPTRVETSAGEPVGLVVKNEHDAQVVLLTLVLAHMRTETGVSTSVSMTGIRPLFELVAALLGYAQSEPSLSSGWRWLLEHGVLAEAHAEDVPRTYISDESMREYMRLWQLQPRLRRLASRLTPP